MRARLAWTLTFAVTAVAGCNTAAGPSCGMGTVLRDGVCVPESMIECGPGTRLDTMMVRCVPEDMTRCGPGTTLDPMTMECRANVTCATGTIEMGGECVPDGSVICTGNTRYDMMTGTCVVDPMACAEGTVFVDGRCVDYEDTLRGMATVHAGAEPDDPLFFDGTPVTFTPPAAGERVAIDGCITPANFDMSEDGTVDADLDFFDFTVSGPGLYRFRAQGIHGLSAAFAILSPDPVLAGWLRVGLNLTGANSERQVYLPRAGQYYIVVMDSRTIDLANIADGLAVALNRPVGDTNTCYLLDMEALPTPAPTALTEDVRMGTLGEPEFFSVTATGRTVVQAQLEAASAAAQPALVMLGGGTYSVGAGSPAAFTLSPIVPDGETVLIVRDYVFNFSPTPVPYTLTLARPREVPATGVASIPHVDMTYSFMWFEGTAGDVVHVNLAAAPNAIAFEIINPAFTAFVSQLCTLGAPCANRDAYVQLTETGRYVVRVYNPTGMDGNTYDVTFTRRAQTPAALMSGMAAPVTLTDEWTFVSFDATSRPWIRANLDSLMGTGFTSAQVRLFNRTLPGALALGGAGAANVPTLDVAITGTTFSRIYGTTGVDMLVAIRDNASWEEDESLNVTMGPETFANVMGLPGMPVARMADAVPAGGPFYYYVVADPGSDVTLAVTPAAGVDALIENLTRTVTVARTANLAGAGAAETMRITVPAAGWVAFAVRAGAMGGNVDATITTTPPPYTTSAGTRTYADVCARPGAAELANGDDVASPPRTLSMLTTFNFFDTPVTQIIADTNGWLTFGAWAGGVDWAGTIPAATSPNFVVTPMWRDTIGSVCIFETPGEAIVQWNGVPFSGTGTVAMQAILYADGRIEFVYSPDQTVFPIMGQVGLENATGDVAVLPPLSLVGPGMSVLFTPR